MSLNQRAATVVRDDCGLISILFTDLSHTLTPIAFSRFKLSLQLFSNVGLRHAISSCAAMSKQILAILLGGLTVLLHGCGTLDKDKICDGNFCKEYCDNCIADMKKGEAEGNEYANHIWESCAHSNKAPCPEVNSGS